MFATFVIDTVLLVLTNTTILVLLVLLLTISGSSIAIDAIISVLRGVILLVG